MLPLQAYPEFCRFVYENSTLNFSIAFEDLEKMCGEVSSACLAADFRRVDEKEVQERFLCKNSLSLSYCPLVQWQI